MKRTTAITLLLLVLSILAKAKSFNTDSVYQIITKAEKGTLMNSIKTEVGPKINALNNWANVVVKNEPNLVIEVMERIVPYAIQTKKR